MPNAGASSKHKEVPTKCTPVIRSSEIKYKFPQTKELMIHFQSIRVQETAVLLLEIPRVLAWKLPLSFFTSVNCFGFKIRMVSFPLSGLIPYVFKKNPVPLLGHFGLSFKL